MSNKTAETLSMRKFCEQHHLERTKVIRWCKAEELDTSGGVGEALGEQILGHFKPLSSSVGNGGAIVTVPSSSVQILPPEKTEALNALVIATAPVVPEKIVPVLNGQCEALVDSLTVVTKAVQAFEGHIEQTERNLDEREAKVQQIATVAQNVGGKLGELKQRSEVIDDRKIEIASQETELKEMLGKLQGML